MDTHVHLAAASAPKDLLEYMRDQMTNHFHEVVYKGLTLGEVCANAGLTLENLSLDRINIQGDASVFDRFDLFNAKYKLAGSSDLKEVFLGYANDCKGRHLAAITKKAHERLLGTDHLFAEYRISVMGMDPNEWDLLSTFMIDNELDRLTHNKWMVQNPR